jgi:Protein of unknown function (DUF3485)
MSRSRKKARKEPLYFRRPQAESKPAPAQAEHTRKLPAWLPPAVAIAVVLIAGVVHGLQTNRWISSSELEEAAARLDDVPYQFGDWTGTDQDVSEDQMKQAGAVAHLHRVYRNSKTGQAVDVMILCGPHGPISLHPPEVCFTGAGYALEDTPEPTGVTAADGKKEQGRFFVCRFKKSTPTAVSRMRTCWAWNSEGRWESPDDPRYAFAGTGHLYKIYVSESLPPAAKNSRDKSSEEFDQGVCSSFLRDFLPVLKKAGI